MNAPIQSTNGIHCSTLSHHYIEYHHQHEADGKTDGAEVGVLAVGGFGDKFLDHDVEHGACGKGEHVG